MSGGLTPWLKRGESVSNSIVRQFELLDCGMVIYMIKMATTSTSHSAFLSSLTQVGLSTSAEANSFVIALFDPRPRPSSSSPLVLNGAAKQGLLEGNRKKAERYAIALQKQKLQLLIDDRLEDAKVEIKRAKKEKSALKNKGKEPKHGWQSE
ncbi:hypothetical protein O181_062485 [Austropuccinia psidii MF-1]|uniref:Uncharacterized protein n=1 Tax=Austropuccinia psidii MF-1 TaxID=1389203 RepID=A0A9Q3EPE5_9BASI|nr:hypothetical protein [Austropuccinia psidii MF-1]